MTVMPLSSELDAEALPRKDGEPQVSQYEVAYKRARKYTKDIPIPQKIPL